MLALEVCLKLSLKKIRVIKFTFRLNYKKKRPKKALNYCDVIEQSHFKKNNQTLYKKSKRVDLNSAISTRF